jgi:Tol biopolymer transport system component
VRPLRIALGLATLSVAAALMPGNATATFPGREGRIAYSDYTNGQIFTVNPNGSKRRQLTGFDRGFANNPSWSPNGRRVIFDYSPGSSPPRIWAIRADGTGAHPVSRRLKGPALDPAYSPNGRLIFYARCLPDFETCGIWRMRADGTHNRALTPYRAGERETTDLSPSVSPNGKRVAFARFSGGGFQARVFVMGSNGRQPHPITKPALEAASPDWAPSGRRLVISSATPRPGSRLYTIKPNGKGLKVITPDRFPHSSAAPSYSPTGRKLVFVDDRLYNDSCCVDLFTSRLNDSGERRITPKNGGAIGPVWGPSRVVP